jgi:predicted  nucleic acid-binding Zn-ribbon protein
MSGGDIVTRETISLVEFERYDEGVKATIKRIQAENTWLRHHYGELEQRVLQLKKDVAALQATATKISKSLVTTSKKTKTRSSK